MVRSNSETYVRESHLVEKGESVELLNNQAEGGKHSNAAVLELSLAENLNIKNIRESKGIEADVTGQGSIYQERKRVRGTTRIFVHATFEREERVKLALAVSMGWKEGWRPCLGQSKEDGKPNAGMGAQQHRVEEESWRDAAVRVPRKSEGEGFLPRLAGCFKKGTDSEKVPGKTAMRGVLATAVNAQHTHI
jgi:hypothetical protein